MKKLTLITVLAAAVYTAVLVVWHMHDPGKRFGTFEPGADNRPEGTARKADDVVIGEFFMKYDAAAPDGLTGSWTGFRGSKKDNICITGTTLKFPQGDFPELWSQPTGEGHAAPVIWNGRVYVLDYNEQLSSDALRCFNLLTGEELWRRWYRVPMKRNHGFSRTIPAVHDGKVVSIGPEGHVMCCDAVTGDMLWNMDMKKLYSSEIPFWYTGQCPYITPDGELILAPAGTDVLLTGIDIRTGNVVWSTPNTLGFKMSHSSVMPMTLGGKPTLVYAGVGGVCGVSASGADKGQLLWHEDKWQPSVLAPSPLQLSDNRIFLVAGYGAGGALLQVDRNGNSWAATVLEQYKADRGLSSEQQTPIMYNGMIITIIPKDGGGMRERLSIYSPRDLHRSLWNSASDERFGLGPYMIIDDRLFAFKENGELFVYQMEQNSMKLLHRQQIIEDGADAWGPMAYADGMLLVRDANSVRCLKITE